MQKGVFIIESQITLPSGAQEALFAIKERLQAWGEDSEWLPPDVATNIQLLIKRCYYYYGKRTVTEMGLLNWECGLGQMLNTRDERIVAILPYLLTAYMFNFRSAKYITSFIEKRLPSSWKASLDDNHFLGISKDPSITDTISGSTPTYGIGKFFSGMVQTHGKSDDKAINDISNLFFFPPVTIEALPELFAETKYVVPTQKLALFRKRVERAKKLEDGRYWDINGNKMQKIIYSELKSNQKLPYPEYRREVYENIFVCWYQTVKSAFCPKNGKIKPYLSYPPKAKESFTLLQSALQRVPIDTLNLISEKEIDQYLDSEFQWLFSKSRESYF